jgi:xanthine dehydrogenase accessory factor
MIAPSIVRALRRANRPTAIILGLNEIASAIAVRVHRMGYGVVMSHDPNPPVIRRGMAFHDALYDDLTALGGLTAVSIDNAVKARAQVLAHECIAVTRNALSDLLVLGEIGVLIDARMQKRVVTPDLRHLARVAIGLGPGFTVGENCDAAIETRPGHEGIVFERKATAEADGVCRDLGGLGRERFIYAEVAGRWHTALDVGTRIFKGFPLGRLGERVITAPMDGLLRGIARDDIDVPARVKLIEIDRRGRRAQWVGMDERGRLLADVTCRALMEFGPLPKPPRGPGVHLVHSK